MDEERERAVKAMESMGWRVEKLKTATKHPRWEFRRPDTGGLWDLVACRQPYLSVDFVAQTAISYGDATELDEQIIALKVAWFEARFGPAKPNE